MLGLKEPEHRRAGREKLPGTHQADGDVGLREPGAHGDFTCCEAVEIMKLHHLPEVRLERFDQLARGIDALIGSLFGSIEQRSHVSVHFLY